MKKMLFSVAAILLAITTYGQESPLKIGVYFETFYSYDFNKPENHIRQPFAYAYNRHNEVNIHLGLIKVAYITNNLRSNLGLMTGTYAIDNMSAEHGLFQNIFEANVGVKLFNNLWLDVGVLPSHIGAESAIGMNHMTLTRSIGAENSPYFETGVKLSYTTHNEKWYLVGLLLNGWQHIARPEANNTPAFGHQITFTPNDKVTFNSSSFIGNEYPDSTMRMRYFHDFYAQVELSEKLSLLAVFDCGMEQKSYKSRDYNYWYSPAMILHYSAKKFNFAARGEYYMDRGGVIISEGFNVFGFSANVDYKITQNAMWRLEIRGFSSKDKLFMQESKHVNSNLFVTTSLAIKL